MKNGNSITVEIRALIAKVVIMSLAVNTINNPLSLN